MKVDAIDHLVINVSDAERAADWYLRVLGMRRLDYGEPGKPRIALLFGRQRINLRPAATTQDAWFTGETIAPRSDDLCFLTSSSPEAVMAHLGRCDIAVIAGPDERSGARGPIRSVYCRDPDGNLIEISSYA